MYIKVYKVSKVYTKHTASLCWVVPFLKPNLAKLENNKIIILVFFSKRKKKNQRRHF